MIDFENDIFYKKELDCFIDDGVEYQVNEYDYPNVLTKNRRNIMFKDDKTDCYGFHSSVYLDCNRIYQPIYLIPQILIELFNKYFYLDDVLVLGCAGCTIPRFIVLNNDYTRIVGVEKSSQMISIAYKYFYIDKYDDRFMLINDDAYHYIDVMNSYVKFDVIYIDLFIGSKVEIKFDLYGFLGKLNTITRSNAFIIYNLLDLDFKVIISFGKKVREEFGKCILINDGKRNFLLAIKIQNNKSKRMISYIINKFGDYTIIDIDDL